LAAERDGLVEAMSRGYSMSIKATGQAAIFSAEPAVFTLLASTRQQRSVSAREVRDRMSPALMGRRDRDY